MNVLLDECVPRKLGMALSPHAYSTVPREGWSGIKNDRLLAIASSRFDVVLTVDRNLQFEQNPATLPIAVIVMRAASNRTKDLLPLMPHVLQRLKTIQRGQLLLVSNAAGEKYLE